MQSRSDACSGLAGLKTEEHVKCIDVLKGSAGQADLRQAVLLLPPV